MQALSKDERFFAQTSPVNAQQDSLDWSKGVTYENVVATIRSVLGSEYPLNKEGAVSVPAEGLPVYDILSNVLQFGSTQTTFFWTRFCKPYASMMQTGNYPVSSQIKLLTFIFARVIGLMGPETHPEVRSLMTIDGSPCEMSWVIPTDAQPTSGEVNRQIRFSVHPAHPLSAKLLRGSQVTDWLVSPEGGLGMIPVKEGHEDWRHACENFFLADDNTPEDDCPPGFTYYLAFILDPSATIKIKTYYMPCARPATGEAITKCPIHIFDQDFTPLKHLMAACHPSLVDQCQLMLEFLNDDSVEARLKPVFHFIGVDIAPSDKNRLKVYFQTREGLSFHDVKRSFTLGGRLDLPDLDKNLERLEMLWNLVFPSTPSNSGKDPVALTNIDDHAIDTAEHPVTEFIWYYEFGANCKTLVPKIYWQTRHYCLNDTVVLQAMQDFYDHPSVAVGGPPDGEHGEGWVIREVEKAFTHRALSVKPGVTTYISFGVKTKGFEMMTYLSPEVWEEREVNAPPITKGTV
ncbi:tryptophan dimethylallyltransferase-domain-containing protein [Pterulicium gracile]|uniref:Tryptophan dimethylallyltransferase-domain-containing protein n=1 Tax=Pterulicium gracile TaxID=1884261 RepID=A0A5C3QMU9_9AGAR|nr:tryptophan dimethylallyltransferase-domain-containing protein [Pterula gracilis]